EAELEEFTFKTVKDGGRAAKMGVQKGDVLKKVGGQEIESLRQLFQFARESEGDDVTFTFQRGAKTFDAKMKKGDLPEAPGRGGERGGQTPSDTVPQGRGRGGER
ncbi:MAG: PDZ domain-containing protein, partial [Planctomycetota bacterium]